MAQVAVELRNVAGTQAALGWAGGHTIVVDRPEGRAGGLGLGFNGAQLLGLAVGGCFCNDLRYAAHEQGVDLGEISVTVLIELAGEPLLVTGAWLDISCTTASGESAARVIDQAQANSTIANSLGNGIPVSFTAA